MRLLVGQLFQIEPAVNGNIHAHEGVEPLLFGIPKNCPEYTEAKRLLKFLDYFIGVSSEDIPKNSILREFIGGSCLDV